MLGDVVGLELGELEGVSVGAGVGAGVSHRLSLVLQMPLRQSESTLHVFSTPHASHWWPPQSTALS